MTQLFACAALILAAIPATVVAQDDVADVPSQDLHVGEIRDQRYFLIGAADAAKSPVAGYGLVVVLPGGDGGANVQPFVKRIYKNALPAGYFVAQLVAPPRGPNQQVVWPTAKDGLAGATFTTEDFVAAVIADVATRHSLNAARVFTLSWSSGGPAAYAVSLVNPKVRGSFVAMSVFKPAELPPLDKSKGHAYYIYHSRADAVCPYRMAEQAEKTLGEKGAKVKLTTYEGGHGWQGNVYGDIRNGMQWLEQNVAR